jgi:molybdopterin converting factor small subunit
MPRVSFTKNLERHVECPAREVSGATVGEVLEAYFAQHPRVRGYVLDEQGAVRKHMVLFVNGAQIDDRERLSDRIGAGDELHVMQALSGG